MEILPIKLGKKTIEQKTNVERKIIFIVTITLIITTTTAAILIMNIIIVNGNMFKKICY